MSRRWLRSSTPSASSDLSPDSPAAAALKAATVGDLSRRLFGKRLLLAIPVAAAAVLTEQTKDAQVTPPSAPWMITGNDNVATDGSHFLGTLNNAPLIFKTNSTGGRGERMRITSDGNVGIGVTNPSAKLSVQSGGAIAFSSEATAPDAKAISGLASAAADFNIGVYGYAASLHGVGVWGESSSGRGVRGTSSSFLGVWGTSDSSEGVRGDSTSGPGVDGFSVSASGVRGTSTSSIGVAGISYSTTGGVGVTGTSYSSLVGIGVSGRSDGGAASACVATPRTVSA